MPYLSALRHSEPLLFWLGITHLLLFCGALIGTQVDARQVMGISAWVKPSKFAISVAVYLLTLAAYLAVLEHQDVIKPVVRWGVALCMAGEITIVFLQAFRGVRSHFNTSQPMDGALFGLMGVLILVNTLLVALLTWAAFRGTFAAPPAVAWGMRLGLVLFLFASAEGFLMISRLGHTVGAADGGTGLPYLNWSRQHGDLRIAHFFAMHALQALPLLGLLTTVRNVQAVAGVWLGISLVLLVRALRGVPLF